MAGALQGIRVIDVSHTAAAAWASRLLADAGADVIFVEPREGGHPLRRLPPFDASGGSIPAANLLANKRAVALDLDSPRSRRYAVDMIRRSDVLVSSHAAARLEQWQLTYADLAKQALVLAHVLPHGAPVAGVEAHAAGAAASAAIVSALLWRDRHKGEGQEVHLAEAELVARLVALGDAGGGGDVDGARFWRRAADRPDGPEYPGPAYRMAVTPSHLGRRVPRPGEHTFNVLRTINNITDDHLLGLYESGVIGMAETDDAREGQGA